MVTFLIIAAAIAVQIFLTARKVSPFLSLLLTAIPMGLLLGMSPEQLLYKARTVDPAGQAVATPNVLRANELRTVVHNLAAEIAARQLRS